MKKIIMISAIVLLMICAVPFIGITQDNSVGIVASARVWPLSGECGENVSYVFDDNTLTISGTGPMYDYGKKESPFYDSNIKNIVVEDGVTSIGSFAFFRCYGIESISLADSVTEIGDFAFSGTILCVNETIVLPENLQKLGKGAFHYCIFLRSINIPESLTKIEPYTFYNCYTLSSIELPESITSIGKSAFEECSSLNSLEISDKIKQIGQNAFEKDTVIDCQKGSFAENYLKENGYVCVVTDGTDEDNTDKGVTDEGLRWEINKKSGVLRLSGEAEMPDYSFYNTPWYNYRNCMTEVIVDEGVKNIGAEAFRTLSGLKRVHLAQSITSIGDSAFKKCTNLEDMNVVSGVTYIGKNAFDGCSALKVSPVSSNTVTIGECAFRNCTSITETIMLDSVKYIGNNAFEACPAIKNFVLRKDIDFVGNNAFSNCTSLTKVTVEDGVEELFEGMFAYCEALTELYLPDSLKSISSYAFRGCSALPDVRFPESVKTIGGCAFEGCTSFENLDLTGIETVEYKAFAYCRNIKSLTIPSSVNTVGSFAFEGCSSLENVVVEEGVTTLDYAVFHNCKNLKNVTLPTTLLKIERSLFKNCNNVSDIYYNGTKEQWNRMVIGDYNACLDTAEIHYNDTARVLAASSKTTSVSLKWNKVESADGYKVYQKISGGWKEICDTDKLSCSVEGLKSSTMYVFDVRSYTFDGENRVISDEKSMATIITRPENAINLRVKKTTGSTVTLEWDEVPGATGYRVFVFTSDGWKALETMPGYSYTYTGAKGYTNYFFTVRPYIKFYKYALWSETFTKVSARTDLASIYVKVASNAKNRATIAWAKSNGATGYQVWYSESEKGGYKKLSNFTNNSTYQYNLESGKTYYYRVRAYRAVDGGYIYSAWSSVESVKIK